MEMAMASKVGAGITAEVKKLLYRKMLTIRRFEERVVELYHKGQLPGLTHSYIGEEAVAAGVCAHLAEADYITSTHRGHGHCIAKGADLKPMMAEILGRSTGYCRGKGGTMHIMDVELGILGAMGIVGSGVPIAVGAAMAAKMRNKGQVAVCFFGDGASNQGAFHEGLNLASVRKLPVLFVCENNLYGISLPQHRHQAIKDIAIRAAAYNMPGVTVDGNDALTVYCAVGEAIDRARRGLGPTLIECKTYRWRGHHEGDFDCGARYRSLEEMESWRKKCPIERLRNLLLKESLASNEELEAIDAEVIRAVDEAEEFARQSPFPKPEEALEGLFID